MARPQLIGRERELAQLERELGRGSLVTVLGTAGTGKTRLALEHARRRGTGVQWVDGRTCANLAKVCRREGALLVVDQFTGGASGREQIGNLRALGPVLVTSRDVVGLPGESVVVLGPLPNEQAVRFLGERLPPGTDASTVAALVELADALPGAMSCVARMASRAPVEVVLRSLEELVRSQRASGRRLPRSATMELVLNWAREGGTLSPEAPSPFSTT